MYICVCNGITEKQVREAAASGAKSVADLQTMLGVATNCGMCSDVASDVLRDARQAPRRSAPVVHIPLAS